MSDNDIRELIEPALSATKPETDETNYVTALTAIGPADDDPCAQAEWNESALENWRTYVSSEAFQHESEAALRAAVLRFVGVARRMFASGETRSEIRSRFIRLLLAIPGVFSAETVEKFVEDVIAASEQIVIEPGRMPQIVDAAEEVLVAEARRLRIFQRSGQVVRVVQMEEEIKNGGLIRPSGTVQLVQVTIAYLRETLERLVNWVRFDRNGEPKRTDCPERVPKTYLDRKDYSLPPLHGVIEAPILRPDGSIVAVPGYDEDTCRFLYTNGNWPPVPDSPTRADAEAGLRELLEPFSEFPFVDEAARSVMIAAILTAIQRRLLESAPLFAFDAPSQRSGKSLLAEAVGLIVTGRKPPATGVARSEDELRKAITSSLLEGQAIVNLDNIVYPLDSPYLARAITQSIYSDRLLGKNEMLRLSTNILWTATGNNLTFRGDMPSRTLVCRIDAKRERPEERRFRISDLPGYLMANRRPLVAAGLTILRAYQKAGQPRQNVSPWGGFDQWSREIREALVWLGLADPCATRERVIVNDPERDSALTILSAWYERLCDRAMTLAEMISEAGDELRGQLLLICADKNNPTLVDARRFAAWCKKIEDRVYGNLQLTRDGTAQRAVRWKVSLVSFSESKTPCPAINETNREIDSFDREPILTHLTHLTHFGSPASRLSSEQWDSVDHYRATDLAAVIADCWSEGLDQERF